MIHTLVHSWLFWIWVAGFIVMSPIAFFMWTFGCTMATDSTHKPTVIKMQLYYTFLAFVMTWLWPIGLLGSGIAKRYEIMKKRRWDKKWAEKKATVPNYWKNYYLILDGKVTDIQVRVLDWNYYNNKARLAIWLGDQRFWADGKEIIVYWPNADLEPIPEKEVKI